jgi:hypothetical protein
LCACLHLLPQLLENVTRHQLTEHLSDILPPIQGALCDEDAAVREAAGAAFGVLFKGGAHGAVESVVPSLLNGLDSPGHASQSLEGLRVILSVRPQVFNGIVPKLLKPPVSSAGLRAIGQLAGTAGERATHVGCCEGRGVHTRQHWFILTLQFCCCQSFCLLRQPAPLVKNAHSRSPW